MSVHEPPESPAFVQLEQLLSFVELGLDQLSHFVEFLVEVLVWNFQIRVDGLDLSLVRLRLGQRGLDGFHDFLGLRL